MKLTVVSTNQTDHTITVVIDNKTRYEYWLKGNYEAVENTVKMLLRNRADGKALNLLKAWANKVDKL